MQSQTIVVGQHVTFTAQPIDSLGNPVSTMSGNATLTQDANTSVASVSNPGAANGLSQTIVGLAPGSSVFILSGKQSDGVTPFSTQFQVVVTAPVVDEPVAFSFTFVIS